MLEAATLTPEILAVLGLLGLTLTLLIFEVLRIDLTALLILVLLGLMTQVPGLEHIIPPRDLLDGFSSNAVLSIVAVMILGAGLSRTGLMYRMADWILHLGGVRDWRVMSLLTGSAGLISSFMPNVGAVALFLPVVSRISARTRRPMSRLLMPMAFCAMLGGNVTIVGSSSLILLNDLLRNANRVLPPEDQMAPFSLFSVAPIGLALTATGVLFFVLFGRRLLPAPVRSSTVSWGGRTAEYFKRVYGLEADIYEVRVPDHSRLVGRTIRVAERAGGVRIIAARVGTQSRVAPHADLVIEGGSVLGVMAGPEAMKTFARTYALELRPQMRTFADALMHTRSGISEIAIPPDSNLIGKSIVEVRFRPTYGLAVLAIHRGQETVHSGIRDLRLQAGDTLVCHSTWENLARLEKDRNLVVITTEYPREQLRQKKLWHALASFLLALGLVLFTELPLALALLTGALGMVLGRVLSMDEAYQAISWKTVFLLAGLIPLGHAVETSGAASWIAGLVLIPLRDLPIWVLQAVIAVLASGLSLLMSNVGATLLLVPLAVNIAVATGANPAMFALTVAIATSNSFLLPTHQANALIVSPGGYRIRDFLRVGSLLSLLYLAVMLPLLNLLM